MKSFLTLLLLELRRLLRSRVWLPSFVIFLSVILYSAYIQTVIWKQTEASRSEIEQMVRTQWDSLGSYNPHGAAHYGSFVFYPISPLGAIDEGVSTQMGRVLRVEGHVQNRSGLAEANLSPHVSRFGSLQPALLLKYVLPLFFIFYSFYITAQDRDSGVLNLSKVYGASVRQQMLARVLMMWLFAILLIALVFVLFYSMLSASNGFASDSLRWVLMPLAFAVYYLLIIALTVYVSVCFKQSSSGLAIMLAAWLLWSLFLPSSFAALAKQRFILPSSSAFEKGMNEDRSKGIDGHNPEEERKKELEQRVLTQYNVKSLDSLPVNFDGIVMQADEEYGNAVWDKHFSALDSINQAQNLLVSQSALINPFQQLQILSSSLAGTDSRHYRHFLHSAELYRREPIKTLNDKLTYGGSKTGDWTYKADAAFF